MWLCRVLRVSVSQGVDLVEIRARTFSDAWLHACEAAVEATGHEVAPMVVVIEGLAGSRKPRSDSVRTALDILFTRKGMATVGTVANTIFPSGLWNPRRRKEA